MKILVRLAFITSLGWLLAACQSDSVLRLYEGPELPDSALLTVRAPEQLELLAINGQHLSQGSTLFSSGQELKLTPGEYRIEAYYKELWTTNVDSHYTYRSDPVTFTVDGEAGEIYRLAYEAPANAAEAERLAEDFSGWSENIATGERRATTGSNLQRPTLLGTLTSGSATPSPAPATAIAPAGSSTPPRASVTESDHESGAESGYLDMLKAYWSQANSDERRAFLRWIAE